MKKNYSLKTKLFYGACICALLFSGSVVAQTYGPNLVVNPGFEVAAIADITPWTYSGNTALESTIANVVSDLKTMRFTNVNSGQFANVSQVITVEENTTYRFSFKGRVLDGVGVSGGTYTAPRALNGEIREGDAYAGTQLLIIKIEQGTDVTVSGEFTVPTGVTKVYLRMSKSFGICYVDDVSVQKKDVSTALSNIFQNNFRVSNNSNSLTIKSEQKLTTINIVNTLGQLIYVSNSPEKEIQLFGLQKGIYIIDATTSDNIKLQYKFIKK